MKRCPFCAEEIQDAAIVCHYCGREFAAPSPQVQPVAGQPAFKRAAKRVALLLAIAVVASVVLVIGMAVVILSTPSSGRPAVLPSASSTPQESPVPAQAEATWAAIASWDGQGMEKTEAFTTRSREWRVRWRASREALPGAGIIQLYVYRAASRQLVSLAANHQGAGADVSYVRSVPGDHYLMINSGNLDWSVTVEERR